MKKIIYKVQSVLLSCMAVTLILLSACQEDEVNPPVITDVRNYAASPDDSVVQTLRTGQWVVIHGKNLSGVSEVYFGSIPAGVNNALYSDKSIVVQVPSIPFPSVPAEELHEITVVNEGGMATFTINIVGPPVITHVRNYAAAPNDTILGSIVPGQHINLIGFNLSGATSIVFQGVEADLSDIAYTDSSAILQVPEDFSASELSQKNRISYTTEIGTGTITIPIEIPIEVGPLLELLTGGVGPGKIWKLDFDAAGVSTHFNGPIVFSGHEVRWEWSCATEGGNCWFWDPTWQSWMPGPADYGTMKFSVDETGLFVTIDQKEISTSGTFVGGYSLDEDTKILSFGDLIPLNMGWNNTDWSQAYLISLTEDAMQLGFKHNSKDEFEIYNYIAN